VITGAPADPDQVEPVRTNPVEQACNHGSPGGAGAVATNQVSLAASDRGLPPDLPRGFTKYYQGSEGRPTGSGLGPCISRGLVASHTGEWVAESKLESGSAFRFTLPLIDLDKRQGS
jgi:signal transduction histidine kinase